MTNINIMPATADLSDRASLIRALFTDEDAYGTTLLVLALDGLGMECLEWHPMTLRTELETQFGCRMSDANFDKLMAALTIVTTDLFFRDVPRFIQLANALVGDSFDPTVFDPADSLECAWAITEALLLSPPEEEEPFSDDVRAYVAFVLKNEGYVTPPDILKIALDADFSAQVQYDFADDPEMFQGIYEVQQGKTAEVETVIRDSLTELLGQLQTLPLQQGNTRLIEQRAAKLLNAA